MDDREPVSRLTRHVFGKLFGDKGYLSQPLRDALRAVGIDFIMSIRRDVTPQLMPLVDRLLFKRCSIIETINDQLKNISQIEHSRHRSVDNFFVNLIAGLVAYCRQANKPSIRLDPAQFRALLATN